jgi:polyisoprenyl-phosphate glycosyltransferase
MPEHLLQDRGRHGDDVTGTERLVHVAHVADRSDDDGGLTREDSMEISVVVPVYKEEGSIRPFLERIEPDLTSITDRYEIRFCLDPSPDRTEEVIQREIERNRRIKLVVFSRRFGQPAATMAGLSLCRGDRCVVIDVDLQDPPS